MQKHELTCMQALLDAVGVERVIKLVGRTSDQVLRFVPHQLQDPRNRIETVSIVFLSTYGGSGGHPTCPRSE